MKDKDIVNMLNYLDSREISGVNLEENEIPVSLLKDAGKGAIEKIRKEYKNKESAKKAFLKKKYMAAAAAILAVVIGFTALRLSSLNAYKANAVAIPRYPEKTNFNDRTERTAPSGQFMNNLENFAFNSSSLVLSDKKTDKNQLYSPISLYMALALAADSASGSTREEIINTLSMNNMNISTINQQSGMLFRYLYFNNSSGQLNLANSLWLNKNVKYKKDFLDSAAKDYYAYSYSVDFSSDKTSKQISQWISHFIKGKLGNERANEKSDPNTILELINTVYFYDEWEKKFDSSATAEDKFYMADGNDVKCDFMNMTSLSSAYAKLKDCTVSSLYFRNGNAMVFILPDKGISPYSIIRNPNLLSESVNALDSNDRKFGKVIFKIPKFKFYAVMDLKSVLVKMGMNKAFSGNLSDFSNISDTKPIYISKVQQSGYIAVNEKGCEASALTEIMSTGSAQSDGYAEMILDRPFIFAITGTDKVPLFIGVVNNPLSK